MLTLRCTRHATAGFASLRVRVNSNVGRHKEHVDESHASRCFQAVKAIGSVPVCTGSAVYKSNAYASFQAGAAPLCRGRRVRWQLGRRNCRCALQSLFALVLIQSAPALSRRRVQMLVSQWAPPLSKGRRGLQAVVPRGSGVGGVQAAPRFPTVVTPNPSFKRTRSGKPALAFITFSAKAVSPARGSSSFRVEPSTQNSWS